MTWLRVLVVLVLLSGRAAATPPPEPCIEEPATASGYLPGALFLGVLARPNPCASIFSARGFDRFPLLFMASALLQLDAGTTEPSGVGVRRARLTLSARLWRRFTVVASGDGAERSLPDAYLGIDLVSPPAVTWAGDNLSYLWLTAGRGVVPFGLEAQWSDAKLPFLERATALEQLAPAQRQHGMSIAALRVRHLDTDDTDDTDRELIWHARLGVFQPFDEPNSYTAIARAFVRFQRRNSYNGFAADLHLGVSAAIGRRHGDDDAAEFRPDGNERRFAIEAEARYRRVRGAAEVVIGSQQMRTVDGVIATRRAVGGALTLNVTLRPNPYRWYTSPQTRSAVYSPWHVDGRDADGPNVGIELDAGIDAMHGDLGATDLWTTKLRAAAQFFVDDHAKLSCTYAFETGRRDHTLIARLQLAL